MPNYAVVSVATDVVINVIVWDGQFDQELLFHDSYPILLDGRDDIAGIGYHYDHESDEFILLE